MAKTGKPRSGSMAFWPRKKAARETPRVRGTIPAKEAKLQGFAGYKVGMTHVIAVDNRKTSTTKGEEIQVPVTVVECPPLRIFGARAYEKDAYGRRVAKDVPLTTDKALARTLRVPKKAGDLSQIDPSTVHDIRALVYTQPGKTAIGKKKPEVFELQLGGSNEDKLNYIKENQDKDIRIADIFEPGQQIDIHSVTKGKGFTGPVQRFGIALKESKAEKGQRQPGSLGPWCGHAHIMYRVPHAGQHGYHTRTEYNKWLMKIGDNPEDIRIGGGFKHYGDVKNDYILLKGSVGGSAKRLVRIMAAQRPNTKTANEAPTIEHVSTQSHQA